MWGQCRACPWSRTDPGRKGKDRMCYSLLVFPSLGHLHRHSDCSMPLVTCSSRAKRSQRVNSGQCVPPWGSTKFYIGFQDGPRRKKNVEGPPWEVFLGWPWNAYPLTHCPKSSHRASCPKEGGRCSPDASLEGEKGGLLKSQPTLPQLQNWTMSSILLLRLLFLSCWEHQMNIAYESGLLTL